MQIDDVGWMVLTELQRDARISFRELGRRVGLSAPAVAERVKKLEAAGVIRGYHAEVDLEAIGMPVIAMVRATPTEGGHRTLEEVALQLPEVREAHRVSGSEHIWMKISARSLTHLDEVLQAFWSVAETTTNLVLRTVVSRRPIDAATVDHTVDPRRAIA